MNYISNFHIELSLFFFRVNLSAQIPIAAVNINAIVAIASIPYSNNVITPAFAASNKVQKVAICDEIGDHCAEVKTNTYGAGYLWVHETS